jgi:hypothetical protein
MLCERFSFTLITTTEGFDPEIPASVPFEDVEPVGHESGERFADERRRCAVRADTERVA